MPTIKKGESRNSYIPRCINYVVKNEGLTAKQAAGKCEGMYDQHLKNKKSKSASLMDKVIAGFKEIIGGTKRD